MPADGMGARTPALALCDTLPGKHPKTITADKTYGTRGIHRAMSPANCDTARGGHLHQRSHRGAGKPRETNPLKGFGHWMIWSKPLARLTPANFDSLPK